MKARAALAVLAAVALALPAAASPGTVGDAKLQPDGAGVVMEQALLTAVGDGFAYAGDLGRACGIRLTGTSFPPKGTIVEASGVISTTPWGERFIQVTGIELRGTAEVRPLVCSTSSAGGAGQSFDPQTGSGQRGATGGQGANSVGQLLTVTGRLTAMSQDHWSMWLDDGSGPAPAGLRVDLPEPMDLEPGAWIRATGPCGLYSEDGSYRAVVQAISLADIVPLVPNIELVPVAAGPFTMGNTGLGMDDYEGLAREHPAHDVYVPAFWIGKTEVTRAQFRSFIQAGCYSDSSLWSPEGWAWVTASTRDTPSFWTAEQFWDVPPGGFTQGDDYPVIGVSYYEAEAFAKWAGGRLPTEAEWEKAARWDGHSRVYPWGDVPGDASCNDWFDTVTTGFQTSAAGTYAGAQSPFGCSDMAGNVWEWTSSWYTSFPGAAQPFDRTGQHRVMKGGSWYGMYGTRCAARSFAAPDASAYDFGFRIAR